MKRNGNMMRAYRKIKCHLRSQAGMTLTEMLAAVLILSMTATAIGGGVAVVKEAYKKTTQKAEAQQVLATTAELITDVLSQAQEVRTGGTSGPEFFNGGKRDLDAPWGSALSGSRRDTGRKYE